MYLNEFNYIIIYSEIIINKYIHKPAITKNLFGKDNSHRVHLNQSYFPYIRNSYRMKNNNKKKNPPHINYTRQELLFFTSKCTCY